MNHYSITPRFSTGIIDSSNYLDRNIVAKVLPPPKFPIQRTPYQEELKPFYFTWEAFERGDFDINSIPSEPTVADIQDKLANDAVFIPRIKTKFKFDPLRDSSDSCMIFIPAADRFISRPYIPDDLSKYPNLRIDEAPKSANLRVYRWELSLPELQDGSSWKDSVQKILVSNISNQGSSMILNNLIGPSPGLKEAINTPSAKVDLIGYHDSSDSRGYYDDKAGFGSHLLKFSIKKYSANKPWSFTINLGFSGGEKIVIKENEAGLEYIDAASNVTKIDFPDAQTRVLESFGPDSFALCIIPVIGGLLISDMLPSGDVSYNTVFIPVKSAPSAQDMAGRILNKQTIPAEDQDKMTKELQKLMNDEGKLVFDDDGAAQAAITKAERNEFMPRPLPLLIERAGKEDSGTDYKDIKRFGNILISKPENLGIDIPYSGDDFLRYGNSKLDSLEFENCIGQFQYVPVFFYPVTSLYQAFEVDPAEAEFTDIKELQKKEGDEDPRRKEDKKLMKTKLMKLDSSSRTRILPIVSIPFVMKRGAPVVPRSCDLKIIKKSQYSLVNMTFARRNYFLIPSITAGEKVDLEQLEEEEEELWYKYREERDEAEESGGETPPEPESEYSKLMAARKAMSKQIYMQAPIEYFGYARYKYIPRTENEQKNKRKKDRSWLLRNSESIITSSDIPESTILSVSVSRTLENSSGSILLDRYDPNLGLLPRPQQFAKSLSLAVQGGNDIVPGIFWTGMAIGNSVVNQENSNQVRINLYGREAKIGDSGIRIVDRPFFDGESDLYAMRWLAGYSALPLKFLAKAYRLPVSSTVQQQVNVTELPPGSTVLEYITKICELAGTQAYFDRFGRLVYLEANAYTGVDWDYPDAQVISYDDNADASGIFNRLVVSGEYQVGTKKNPAKKPVQVSFQLETYPSFPYDKMRHYPINAEFASEGEFILAALRVAKFQSRMVATGSVTIPGNANIELLDRFNKEWLVVGINHNLDTQAKTFTTALTLEQIITGSAVGKVRNMPIPVVEPPAEEEGDE